MTDGQLWLVPTDKSNAYRCQKGSTINYLKQREEYFREVFTEFDQLRSFIRMCTKNQIDVLRMKLTFTKNLVNNKVNVKMTATLSLLVELSA